MNPRFTKLTLNWIYSPQLACWLRLIALKPPSRAAVPSIAIYLCMVSYGFVFHWTDQLWIRMEDMSRFTLAVSLTRLLKAKLCLSQSWARLRRKNSQRSSCIDDALVIHISPHSSKMSQALPTGFRPYPSRPSEQEYPVRGVSPRQWIRRPQCCLCNMAELTKSLGDLDPTLRSKSQPKVNKGYPTHFTKFPRQVWKARVKGGMWRSLKLHLTLIFVSAHERHFFCQHRWRVRTRCLLAMD